MRGGDRLEREERRMQKGRGSKGKCRSQKVWEEGGEKGRIDLQEWSWIQTLRLRRRRQWNEIKGGGGVSEKGVNGGEERRQDGRRNHQRRSR